MRYEENCLALACQFPHATHTFPLKASVTYCENLVEKKYIGIQVSRHGEGKTYIHSA